MRCAQPAVRRGRDTRPTLLPEKGLFLQAESSTLRGAAAPRLGEFLRARQKAHCNVLLQCAFCFNVILVLELF